MDSPLRFSVGDPVECNLDGKYHKARIAGCWAEGPRGKSPYRIEVIDGEYAGEEVFAREDADCFVRERNKPVRFKKGDKVEAATYEGWQEAEILETNEISPTMGPYFLQLVKSGKNAIAMEDSDRCIRAPKGEDAMDEEEIQLALRERRMHPVNDMWHMISDFEFDVVCHYNHGMILKTVLIWIEIGGFYRSPVSSCSEIHNRSIIFV